MTARVGFVGVGAMGLAMAGHALKAGFQVAAYDVDADKRSAIERAGAKAESTAGVVIAGCEINVLCVFNTQQVEEVIAGPGGGVDAIAQGGTGARIFVVTSTCDPEKLAAVAQRVASAGAHVVEAPISGTSRQVANGDGVTVYTIASNGRNTSRDRLSEKAVKASTKSSPHVHSPKARWMSKASR